MSLSRRWVLSAAGAAFLANLSRIAQAHEQNQQTPAAGGAPPPGAGGEKGSGKPGGGSEFDEVIKQYQAALAAERKAGNVAPTDAEVDKRMREIYEERFNAKLACGELSEETLRRVRWQAYLLGALSVEMWRFEKAGTCKAGGTPRKVKLELRHLDHARDAFWNISKKGSAVRKAIESSKDEKARKSLAYADHQCPIC